jgi:hypothetical protein
MRLGAVCRALLVLDLGYCAAALFVDALPGWKMFARGGGQPDYQLEDARGKPVALDELLPRHAYGLTPRDALDVARFACRTSTRAQPLRFRAGPSQPWTLLESPDCAGASPPGEQVAP